MGLVFENKEGVVFQNQQEERTPERQERSSGSDTEEESREEELRPLLPQSYSSGENRRYQIFRIGFPILSFAALPLSTLAYQFLFDPLAFAGFNRLSLSNSSAFNNARSNVSAIASTTAINDTFFQFMKTVNVAHAVVMALRSERPVNVKLCLATGALLSAAGGAMKGLDQFEEIANAGQFSIPESIQSPFIQNGGNERLNQAYRVIASTTGVAFELAGQYLIARGMASRFYEAAKRPRSSWHDSVERERAYHDRQGRE